MGSLVPLRVQLHIEVNAQYYSHKIRLHFVLTTNCFVMHRQIGTPLIVEMKPKSEITQQDVDCLHQAFCDAMTNLFEKTKSRHGCTSDQKLIIV